MNKKNIKEKMDMTKQVTFFLNLIFSAFFKDVKYDRTSLNCAHRTLYRLSIEKNCLILGSIEKATPKQVFCKPLREMLLFSDK